MAEWISKLLAPLINALLNPPVTASIAATAAILLYLNSRRFLPVTLEPRFLLLIIVVGILFGSLACINIASSLWTATQGLRRLCVRRIAIYRDRKRIEGEIAFLTPKERSIIAYLLAKKQKMFEVLPDGEEAITLISKGFVVYPARRPMGLHRDVAVEIPNYVWEVLLKHQNDFPYEPQTVNKVEIHPWRTHWMAR
jgi:hypothetical protein